MKLIDRLPKEFGHGEFHNTRAFTMREVEIIKEYDGTKIAWPGKHKNVHTWFELANGYVVGWNENPSVGWSFPVVKTKWRS